jgi:hypothetical protein
MSRQTLLLGLLTLLIFGGVLLWFLWPTRSPERSPLSHRLQTTGEFTIPEGTTFLHMRVVGFCEQGDLQMVESVIPAANVHFTDTKTGTWSATTSIPAGPCQVHIVLHLLDNATGQPRNLILEPMTQQRLAP